MTKDFIGSHGRAFLAHRLRRSSDRIVEQVGAELLAMGLDIPPRGASMLLLIDEAGPIGVVEVSRRLRLSHPLIVRMARQFEALGLVTSEKDLQDSRRKQLVSTAKGHDEAQTLRAFNIRVSAMFADLFADIGCDVIETLDRLDAALAATPVEQRLALLQTGASPDET